MTPTIEQLRARLAPLDGPITAAGVAGFRMDETQRTALSKRAREEELGLVGVGSELAGDPDEGLDPDDHVRSIRDQNEQINAKLLASFKESLDSLGSTFCPAFGRAATSSASSERVVKPELA